MFKMKTSINQMITTAFTVISRQNQAGERISEVEDKIGEAWFIDHYKYLKK
jgi:hypothetical protein